MSMYFFSLIYDNKNNNIVMCSKKSRKRSRRSPTVEDLENDLASLLL